MPDVDQNGAVKLPRPLAAVMGIAGLIAAIIAIAAGPGWVIGAFGGTLVVIAIPPLRRPVLRWPTNPKACAIAAVIIVAAGIFGSRIGQSGGEPTLRSPHADVPATGYKDGKWFEQEGEKPVEAFRVPGLAAGATGRPVKAFQVVQVSCRRYVAGVESAHPEGYWYRLSERPWSNKAYAPANAFWNGVNIVSGPGVRYTDLKVPTCE